MARKKKFAPNDNNLAIAYYRFSSHSQNDASIDQQRDLAHEWADAHGFKIVQEYEDAAISGTTDARPGFQQMLSEVAKIRPHTLIMWKTDRLGRDKYVLAMAKKKIRDAGCEIHLLAENIPTEGPEGVLIEGLMEAMAEYYSRQLSQNIQRGMDYNAQHALYNGHKLFGYDVDRSTKEAQIRTAGVFRQRNVRVGVWEIKFTAVASSNSRFSLAYSKPSSFFSNRMPSVTAFTRCVPIAAAHFSISLISCP